MRVRIGCRTVLFLLLLLISLVEYSTHFVIEKISSVISHFSGCTSELLLDFAKTDFAQVYHELYTTEFETDFHRTRSDFVWEIKKSGSGCIVTPVIRDKDSIGQKYKYLGDEFFINLPDLTVTGIDRGAKSVLDQYGGHYQLSTK